MITEPSAPRVLPPVSASASSIRKSVSGGSPASRSISAAARPVSASQLGHRRCPGVSSCAKHPSNRRGSARARSEISDPTERNLPREQAARSRRTRPSADPSVPSPDPVAKGRATCGPNARALCGTDDPMAKNREKSTSQSSVSGISCGRPVAGVADEVAEADHVQLVVERVDFAHEAVAEPADAGHELARRAEQPGAEPAAASPPCSGPRSAGISQVPSRSLRIASR